MLLKDRCNAVISDIGIPVTVFCRKVGISTASYYRWLLDDLKLKDSTLCRIEKNIEFHAKLNYNLACGNCCLGEVNFK